MPTATSTLAPSDLQAIAVIGDRIAGMLDSYGVTGGPTRQDVDHALTAVPLRLAELAEAPDEKLLHDVFGLWRNIDRETGELRHGFKPIYAA